MKRFSILILAIAVAFAPVLAEARAGGSYSRSYSAPSRSYSAPSRPAPSYNYKSQGSAGTRTYTPSQTYQPTQRSVTPPTVAAAPRTYAPAPTQTYRSAGVATAPTTSTTTINSTTINHGTTGGSGAGSTFLAAAGGAAVGAVVGNALSQPHYAPGYAPGYAPAYGQPGYVAAAPVAPVAAAPTVVDQNGVPVAAAPVTGGYVAGAPAVVAAPVAVSSGLTFMGFLWDVLMFVLVFALIALVVWGLVRLFRSREEEVVVSHTHVSHTHTHDEPVFIGDSYAESSEIHLTAEDKAEFKSVLANIQKSWSLRDKPVLRGLLTVEMFDYFVDAMDDNTAQGVINRVEDVSSIECDVLEAWSDDHGDFARCIMRWKAHDYTTDLNGNTIDAGEVGYSKETWTFIRQHGAWVLSQVNQMD